MDGSASRSDLDTLILDKLPDILTKHQKETKMNNLLSKMSRLGIVKNAGSRKMSKWVLGSR